VIVSGWIGITHPVGKIRQTCALTAPSWFISPVITA
jgi:hypothetical protein